MKTYYLAVDIGASSGRHILGSAENGRISLEEIYRFPNGMKERNGRLCWDMEELFFHIKEGMKQCRKLGKLPVSMGIDTWAVDFVLLNSDDQPVGDTVGYRDLRTQGMDEKVYEIISPEELYSRTGIQKQIFNTIYQFMAVKEEHPEYLQEASSMLMIPDYFHFLLTGVKKQEYTNATTTQLVSPETKDWDYELIHRLGYPRAWFGPLSMPGTLVGPLLPEIAEEVGFSCSVVLPATHDTGSAVLAVPSNEEDILYISSGTWSLMGTERKQADCSADSRKQNFTNEGGYGYRFRYLKNIMGLWMIQSVKKELSLAGQDYSFAELCQMASEETTDAQVDCNDGRFLAPDSMIQAVQGFCREAGFPVPETAGELAAVIYNSLAACYRDTVKELEAMTGTHYEKIHIVGGGSNAGYLNRLTAAYTGRPVLAGPAEATAIGNLAAQMIRSGVYKSLSEARQGIFESFAIKEYRPQPFNTAKGCDTNQSLKEETL